MVSDYGTMVESVHCQFQIFPPSFARLDFKLARALAIFAPVRRLRIRSLDVGETAVTSQVAHTTDASDAERYATSVPSAAAPSHLGPRSRPALAKGCEGDDDVGARKECAQSAGPRRTPLL